MKCAYCGAGLLGGHWRFCDGICRQAAYRRRCAGLAEDAFAGSGRRGRVPLAGKTRVEFKRELLEIRSRLDGSRAILAAHDLLNRNRHLTEAVDRLEALRGVAAEELAERDGTMQR